MEKLRNYVLLILVFSQLCLGSPSLPAGPNTNFSLKQQWESFKSFYNKGYRNEAEEVGEERPDLNLFFIIKGSVITIDVVPPVSNIYL